MSNPTPNTPRVVAEWTDDLYSYQLQDDGEVNYRDLESGDIDREDDPAGLGPKLARLIADVEAMPCAFYGTSKSCAGIYPPGAKACPRCDALARVRS